MLNTKYVFRHSKKVTQLCKTTFIPHFNSTTGNILVSIVLLILGQSHVSISPLVYTGK